MLKMDPDHGEPVYRSEQEDSLLDGNRVCSRNAIYPLPLANFALPFSMSASARFGPQRPNGRNCLSCI